MKKKFYPLGSIVRLKNGTKRIMICGRLQMRESDKKVLDYFACYYTEGILYTQELFLFQHEDIEELCFTGFQDQEEEMLQQFIQKRCKELQL